MSVVGIDRVKRMLAALLRPGGVPSPHGLRSLSARHRDHPAVLQLDGLRASVDYEPAESTTPMFGGNSNWRGPVWFPVNYLAVAALDRFHRFFGDDLEVEYPTGSGQFTPLDSVADDLRARLISTFLGGPDGRRPCFGGVERMQSDPRWRDQDPVLRVLPRRQRRRARGVPPDRVDGAGRRPDPAPPPGRAFDVGGDPAPRDGGPDVRLRNCSCRTTPLVTRAAP